LAEHGIRCRYVTGVQPFALSISDVRVVSMPSWDGFEKQDESYKNDILPAHISTRVAVEMASPFGWERYVGREGKIIGVDTFGASAPGRTVIEQYGFTVKNVVNHVESLFN